VCTRIRFGQRPWRRWTLVGAGATVALAAVATGALRQVRDATRRDPADDPAAASSAIGRPTGDRGDGSFQAGSLSTNGLLPPLGSAAGAGTAPATGMLTRADSLARRAADSLRRAQRAALIPSLSVAVPTGAEVYVDGTPVGRGPVQRETLPVGRHVIRATVASLPGCPSADTNVVVDLTPGARRTVRLDPVACGRLEFDVVPTPAQFRLVPTRGGPVREGILPLGEPLLLPDGEYALTIESRECAPYEDTRVPVVAGRTRTERARLLCR